VSLRRLKVSIFKIADRRFFCFTTQYQFDTLINQRGGITMDILIREHDVSATVLEVVLKGMQKDTIKLSEFDNKFKPALLNIEGVTSAKITSDYGNAFEVIQIDFQKGTNKASLASKLSKALGQILDLNIRHEYRESDPLDYL
jgi:hypothetical protein